MLAGDYLVMSTSLQTKIFHLPTRRYYCLPETGPWPSESIKTRYHEYRLTSTHLIDFHLALPGVTTIIQAFLLPHVDNQHDPSSDAVVTLTRTHVGHCDFTFTESEPLHSHSAHLGSYTFMAFESTYTGHLPRNSFIIVDVVLSPHGQSLGTITATKMYTEDLGNMNYNIMHTSRGGITRAISYSGITSFSVNGFTIVKDSDRCSVEVRVLLSNHLPGQVICGAFDGYRGRICLMLQSPIHIEIQDYV